MSDVQIKTIPEMSLVYVAHKGPYPEIKSAYQRLFTALQAQGLPNGQPRPIAVFYDDPSQVPAEELRSRAAIVAQGSESIVPPLETMTLAGGSVAVLRHKGPYADLKSSYDRVYCEWLPTSGHERRDGPDFEEYLNSPMDTAPEDLLTDIFVPLRS